MDQGGYGGHPFQQGAGPQQAFGMHGPLAPQQYASGGPPPPPPSYLQPPPPIQFTYHPLPFVAGFPPPTPPQIHPHPPHISFFNPWDPTPHFAPPPPDIELHKRIDKLVEYAAKNGPEFENMLKEKQRDNPAYAFLFGAEGYHYYRYKLWISVNAHLNAFNPSIPPPLASLTTPSFSLPSPLSSLTSQLPLPTPPPPVPSASPFPPFYETAAPLSHHQPPPQTSQTFFQHDSFSDSDTKPFKGLSGPLPADVATELKEVLENLTGTKESIKGAKTWFMQRSPFAPALAEALKDRVLALDDAERQLHVIYLANDILFDSLQRRGNIKELDNEALAFQPVLGSMLGAIYHNFQNQEANQTRLQKILQFWAAKEVYSTDIINNLDAEMIARPSPQPRPNSPKPSAFQPSSASGLSLPSTATTAGQVAIQTTSKWQAEQPRTSQAQAEQLEQEQQPAFSAAISSAQFIGSNAQFTSASQPLTANPVTAVYSSVAVTPSFIGSLPIVTPVVQPALAQLPTMPSLRSIEHPPYPLFPPGLIPGMVRKMQIGSGVPYSPLSPLDIPTVIPPSTVSDAYILERVAKFFKDIGEIDPLEGQSNARGRDAEDDIEEERGRSGGARIPPPPNLQVDAETNTLPDGSMEHKPGSTSSGRLGLGATADPNEVTQYDDVYTSYRKQRSTNYHTTMSARAAAR